MTDAQSRRARIRVLAVVEAASVTGPARNLIDFSQAARQAESGPAVEILFAAFQRGGSDRGFLQAAQSAGIEIHRISETRALDPGVVGRLREIVARTSPDVLQTHSVKSHFLMRLTGLWRERPWVAFHHGYTTEDLKMRAYNQLDRWSLRAPMQIVTVSEAYRRQLSGLGIDASKVAVIHNAVSPAWVERVRAVDRTAFRAQLGLGAEEKVVLAIGRMSREKAHADLLAAFDRLRPGSPGLNVRLVLVGDGPERRRLEKAHPRQVLFTGQVRDTAPYYAVADLLVLPSRVEGSPNVLLEAMAAEVPVVATEAGGIPEIVRSGESAQLVAPGDVTAMAREMDRLLTARALAEGLARRARETVETRHSPRARARILIDLYARLAAGGDLRVPAIADPLP